MLPRGITGRVPVADGLVRLGPPVGPVSGSGHGRGWLRTRRSGRVSWVGGREAQGWRQRQPVGGAVQGRVGGTGWARAVVGGHGLWCVLRRSGRRVS